MSDYEAQPLPDCYGQYNDQTKYCHDNCQHRDLCKNKTTITQLQQKLNQIKN